MAKLPIHPSDNRAFETFVELDGKITPYRFEVVKRGRKYVAIIMKTVGATEPCRSIDETLEAAKVMVAKSIQVDETESFMLGK